MAMPSIVLRMPFVIPGAAGYPVDPGQLAPLIPVPFETEAAAHWMFGTDNPYSTDMVADQQLTRALSGTVTGGTGYPASSKVALVFTGGNGAGASGYASINASGVPTDIVIVLHGSYTVAPNATLSTVGGGTGAAVTITLGSAPTLAAGSLTTAVGVSGMATGLPHAADQTIMAVFQKHASTGGLAAIIVDSGTRAAAQTIGATTFVGSGAYSANTGGNTGAVAPPTAPAAGAALFLGMSHSSANGRVVQWGGGAAYTASVGQVVDTPTPRRIGIGNVNFGNSFGYVYGTTFHSLIVINRALSAGEMLAVCAREKVRLATRGVTVNG